jgi:hypothetical protein
VALFTASLLPLVALTALLFLADALILRLDLLPLWSIWGTAVLLVAFAVLIISVFQIDTAASLTEDWLCRPLRKREFLGAKIVLVLAAVYLPHALGTVIVDVSLGFPMSEVLLDAVLLPDELFLILMPILMFIAVITRTLIQAFGVLFAIFICVFVIPTPFVRPPGPLDLGIFDELLTSGMIWLAIAPVRLASPRSSCSHSGSGTRRRRLQLGARPDGHHRPASSCSRFVLPMGLMPWKSTFALQAASGPAPPADSARISLRSMRTCFPPQCAPVNPPMWRSSPPGTAPTMGWRRCAVPDKNSVAF